MTLSNTMYDRLKWLITIALPALAAFVATIGTIYGLDWTEAAVATIAAVTVLLGALFMQSSKTFKKEEGLWGREMVAAKLENTTIGDLIVQKDPGGITYTLEPADDDLDKLADRDFVSFRVVK